MYILSLVGLFEVLGEGEGYRGRKTDSISWRI
jgi:hypothetical protein